MLNKSKFDGTFYTVPSICYQLFTIFITFHGHCIPVVNILMQNKTENLYTSVVLKLRELILDFSPKIAVSDFEKAPRNAFTHFFPGIKVFGCWFHSTQAIWKKTQFLGLEKLYKNNSSFANWLRKLMALPLLPKDKLVGVFSILEIGWSFLNIS